MADDLHIAEEQEETRGCCNTFWGPFHPVFGGHSLKEAGSSAFVSLTFVLVWRTAFALFFSATFIAFVVTSNYNLLAYETWMHAVLSISVISSAVSTFRYKKVGRNNSAAHSKLAFFTVFLTQIVTTAFLFIGIVFFVEWSVINIKFANISQGIVSFTFVLLDLFLTLRMDFKLIYALMSVIGLSGIRIITFVLGGGHLGFDPVANEQFLANWVIGLLVFVLPVIVVSFVTFLLSRFSRCLRKVSD